MQTYWGFIRNDGGGFIRVTVQAANAYNAQEILKALYGAKLFTQGANLVT